MRQVPACMMNHQRTTNHFQLSAQRVSITQSLAYKSSHQKTYPDQGISTIEQIFCFH